jgi:lysozyme
MQLSAEGLDLIKPHETFPKAITEAQAAAILATDVQRAEQSVTRLVKVALTQGQFDALVDFCFNLGAARLQSSTLLRELNVGNHQAAGEQLLAWDHAGGVVVAGLKARREAELLLWSSGG